MASAPTPMPRHAKPAASIELPGERPTPPPLTDDLDADEFRRTGWLFLAGADLLGERLWAMPWRHNPILVFRELRRQGRGSTALVLAVLGSFSLVDALLMWAQHSGLYATGLMFLTVAGSFLASLFLVAGLIQQRVVDMRQYGLLDEWRTTRLHPGHVIQSIGLPPMATVLAASVMFLLIGVLMRVVLMSAMGTPPSSPSTTFHALVLFSGSAAYFALLLLGVEMTGALALRAFLLEPHWARGWTKLALDVTWTLLYFLLWFILMMMVAMMICGIVLGPAGGLLAFLIAGPLAAASLRSRVVDVLSYCTFRAPEWWGDNAPSMYAGDMPLAAPMGRGDGSDAT